MIKITCDSASDLPRSLWEPYRIHIFPMEVRLGKHCQQDQIELTSGDIYNYSQKTGRLPEVSAVPVSVYRKTFEDYIGQGFQVLHVSLSGKLSECYRNACLAARSLPGVSVIDSKSVSAGAGQLAMLASELASADYLLNELTDALNEMKEKMDVSCILQTPEYLHKIGHHSSISALLSGFFRLKPELMIRKGKIRPIHAFRGDLENSILSYVQNCISGRTNIQTDRIFITYSAVPLPVREKVKILLRQLQPFEEILEIPVSSAVSCRCGPGSLGLAFMTR